MGQEKIKRNKTFGEITEDTIFSITHVTISALEVSPDEKALLRTTLEKIQRDFKMLNELKGILNRVLK